MADDVPNLRGGNMSTLAFVIGPLLAAVVFVGGLVWQAAHYPTRDEFQVVKDTIHALDKSAAVQEVHTEALRIQVEAVKAQGDRIEQKVDNLTNRRRGAQ